MTGSEFARMLADRLEPDLERLGYHVEGPSIDGKEYSATFTAPDFRLLVSYEPGDDWLAIYFQRRVDTGWSELDDRQLTPRLDDLTRCYSGRLKVAQRHRRPSASAEDDPAARRLAQAIDQIPLVLPAYMEDVRAGNYRVTG